MNPLSLSNLATPVLGGTWAVRLDCTGYGNGFGILTVAALPVTIPRSFGEVLAGGPRYLRRVRPHLGSVVTFTEPIPNQTALIGLTACVQGVCTGGGGMSLSNAIDLVLGF